MNILDDKEMREAFFLAQGKIEKGLRLDIANIGVFRLISGKQEINEIFGLLLFSPGGEPLYVSPAPVYRSHDGDYHQYLLKWHPFGEYGRQGLLNHVKAQLIPWIKENDAEITCKIFHCEKKDTPVLEKMRKICNDSEIGLITLVVVLILFGVLRSINKVEYLFEHNFNTQLIDKIINKGYITQYEGFSDDAKSFIGFLDSATINNKDMKLNMGLKLIPITRSKGKCIGLFTQPWMEANILYLVHWLRIHGIFLNSPTIYNTSIICGDRDLFMNAPVRNIYDLDKATGKVLGIVLENLAGRTAYFYLKNFDLQLKYYANITPGLDEYEFLLFSWIFALTLLHKCLNVVHLDLHLNNIMIGLNPVFSRMVSLNKTDSYIEWRIGTKLVLYTPIHKLIGYILDFSRAVLLDNFEMSYDQLESKIPGIKDFSRSEVQVLAKMYDFESLLDNLIAGMREMTVGGKVIFDALPKRQSDKFLEIRRYLENTKKAFIAGELGNDYSPGMDLLERFFRNFATKPKYKRYKFVATTEMTQAQQKELQKYKKKVLRGDLLKLPQGLKFCPSR